jgi:hypothetical protein
VCIQVDKISSGNRKIFRAVDMFFKRSDEIILLFSCFQHSGNVIVNFSTFNRKVRSEQVYHRVRKSGFEMLFLSVCLSTPIAVSQLKHTHIGVLGFDSRRGLGILLLTTGSRTALGPTQPPIQWVPGALSLGVKRPGREAYHSPPSSAEVKEWVELYLHSPTRLHGVVLS